MAGGTWTQTPARRSKPAVDVAALFLRIPIRLPLLKQLEPGAHVVSVLVVQISGRFQCLLLPFDSLLELTIFGMGRSERVEIHRIFVFRKPASLGSMLQGAAAIAKVRLRASRQKPGQRIVRVGVF